jgi:hypothetical protein
MEMRKEAHVMLLGGGGAKEGGARLPSAGL